MSEGRISANGSRGRARGRLIRRAQVVSAGALLAVVIGLIVGPVASLAGAEDSDPNATTSSDPATTTPAPPPPSDSAPPAPTSSDPAPTTQPAPTPSTPAAAPTIQSDKADYFPGEQVTLTGSNWKAGDAVHIVVNDNANQSWKRDVHVQADAAGNVVDVFNLPDWFIALYTITATGSDGRVATTSFTDSPKEISPSQHEGQRSDGTYTSGNITQYTEGDSINFRFNLNSTHGPANGDLEVRFTGDDGDCLFFDNSFVLGAVENLGGPQPTVTVKSGPTPVAFGTSSGEWVVVLHIDYPTTFDHDANTARVNYTLKLSDEAGQCNGSSQHSRLNAPPNAGDVKSAGAQNVPVPAQQVIELPDITVIKRIDRNGDGTFESTATAGEFCFTLDSSGSCVPTNAQGQVVFTNVTPNGAHTVTETQLNFSQGTYPFVSGSGTNCTFNGSIATATVASGVTPTNATCTFNDGGKAAGSAVTTIHDAGDNGDTSATVGDTVHDSAAVTGVPGGPTPTGTVTFRWFENKDCTGDGVASGAVALDASGVAHPSSSQTPLAAGDYAFQGSYGGDNSYSADVSDCEPLTEGKAASSAVTTIHDAGHNAITSATVGDTVHDSAAVTGVPGGPTPTGTVTFRWFENKDCTGDGVASGAVALDASGVAHPSSSQTPLAAGDYAFQGSYGGDNSYSADVSDCEPLTVGKANTATTTHVHDPNHNDVTNGKVSPGTAVHDQATVTGVPSGPTPTGTVTFSLYATGNCTGTTVIPDQTVPVGTESSPQTLAAGAYSYKAVYSGDHNYNGSQGVCEPFSVFQPGKTMGYWGNKHGQQRSLDNGGYAANAVNIGRGANIDSKAESLKVLPNTLNACGKGNPQIFTVGGSTNNSDCTVATGINKNSLNTLAAQTLALGYNIKLVSGFSGQTVGALQCTGSGTVNDAFTAAVALINGSASGGSTTQSQIGAMNQLLGCLNREA